MTMEELNTLIAKAEGGDVAAMNELTHIYGEVDGFINQEQAAKWFLALIQKDCDPNSGVYENTGYNKDLYAKIKSIILNSTTEEEMMSAMYSGNGGSLFGGAISFTTSNAKSYINQAEEALRKAKAEAELARRKAEEEKFENWAKRSGIVDYLKYIRAKGGGYMGGLTYSQYKSVRELYMKHKSYEGVLLLDKQYYLYCERLLLTLQTTNQKETKSQRNN